MRFDSLNSRAYLSPEETRLFWRNAPPEVELLTKLQVWSPPQIGKTIKTKRSNVRVPGSSAVHTPIAETQVTFTLARTGNAVKTVDDAADLFVESLEGAPKAVTRLATDEDAEPVDRVYLNLHVPPFVKEAFEGAVPGEYRAKCPYCGVVLGREFRFRFDDSILSDVWDADGPVILIDESDSVGLEPEGERR